MVTTVAEIRDIVSRNLVRVEGAPQFYDWGKQGSDSLVARLGPNALGPNFKLNEHRRYAEVWMGTHQNGVARCWNDPDLSLQRLVAWDTRHFLGDKVLSKWPNTTKIPYLFKILSIDKALPLQVHPDKRLAEDLHWKDPKNFVDSNHKPEIAVAIGEDIEQGSWGEGVAFTGFVGFQPLDHILKNLQEVPELRKAVGDEAAVEKFLSDPTRATLRGVYSALLTRPQNDVAHFVGALYDRVSSGNFSSSSATDKETARLITKIYAQYPGGVGLLATVFFLNFVKLRRGESIYIGADEIHAYLEGDIIECMAVSDNVINSAFVPSEQRQAQAAQFLEALTFTARPAEQWKLPRKMYPRSRTGATTMYAPPSEEFVVLGTSLREGLEEVLEPVKGPTTGVVTKGKVRVRVGDAQEELGPGGIVFVAPGKNIYVDQLAEESEVWWATCMV